MSTSKANHYVAYGSQITEAAPVSCRCLTEYAFLVEVGKVGRVALEGLCHRVFHHLSARASGPSVVACIPLDTKVLLQVNTIEWVGGNLKIGTAETELLIHVPVDYYLEGTLQGQAFFTPFIWVNNTFALVGGREVYGYAKAFANTSIGLDRNDQLESAELRTLSVLLGENRLEQSDLLTIEKKSDVLTRGNELWELINRYELQHANLTPAQREYEERFVHADPMPLHPHFSPGLVELVGAWLKDGITTQIFLKQFRCGDGSNDACFQEISIAKYSATEAPTLDPMNHKYALTIQKSESAPLSDLGIEDQNLVCCPINNLFNLRRKSGIMSPDGQT